MVMGDQEHLRAFPGTAPNTLKGGKESLSPGDLGWGGLHKAKRGPRLRKMGAPR